ncbi:hypothetical protein QTP88_006023 [Uroleucon formosanum]
MHGDEYSILSITRFRSLLKFNYSFNDTLLRRVTYIKDLGINYTSTLNFEQQNSTSMLQLVKL